MHNDALKRKLEDKVAEDLGKTKNERVVGTRKRRL